MDFIQPAGWKRPSGYSNGVVASGKQLFVAGQIGWNPTTCAFETDDFIQQFKNTLANVVAVVRAAGGEPSHIARLTVYVTDKKKYLADLPAVGAAYRAHLGKHFPAMALVQVSALVEDRALVEIEATAVIP
ncbi:MAG: RidA family protein [Deltaproteobacteria bacterium]|nr:RidA family protein [Deltaproteobacteria bacterium]